MLVSLSIPLAALALADLECMDPTPAYTSLPGTLALVAMNDAGICVGTLDGSTEQMVVWADGEVVTRVITVPESMGVLINNSGQAAGIGSYGIFQDDRLIRADASGNYEILSTITGSEGWSHATAMNEQGSIVGNYSKGSGSSVWQSFIWTDDDGLVFLDPTADSIYARDIDEQNRVIGQALYGKTYHAILWADGQIHDLSKSLGFKGNAAAWRFDDADRILVSEHLSGAATYYWYDPSSQSLETIHAFPSGTYSLRNAAAGNGTVGFSWSTPSGDSYAARWSPEKGFVNLQLPEDTIGFTLSAISGEGHLAGTAFELPFYNQTALLFDVGAAFGHADLFIPGGATSTRSISLTNDGDLLMWADQVHWVLSPRCEGDADGDGQVNVTDLLMAISAWGTYDEGACGPDVDGDGVVNVNDVLAIISAWGDCDEG